MEPIRIKEADNMPYKRWLAYMQLKLINLGLRKTHCISKHNHNESWLIPHGLDLEKYLHIKKYGLYSFIKKYGQNKDGKRTRKISAR
jgi:hypothetical protein